MELDFFRVLELFGTVAFAISGALSAMQRRLDLFGIFIVAFVTAIGGGTLRDTLIGETPVKWMENGLYVYLIGIVTIFVIIFRNKLYHLRTSLFLFDTIGLGVFTITGVETGIQHDLNPIISIALGAMTGTFGGVIRDILCNEIPVIFHREIYATACIGGGAAFFGMTALRISPDITYLTTTLIVIGIRLAAVKYEISLPSFSISEE